VGQSSRTRVDCIDLNTLAAFAEGLVDPLKRVRVEEHLAECADCRAIVGRSSATPSTGARSGVGSPREGVAEALSPGTRVGRYVIEQRLGHGGMGAVYAAADPDLNRRVAVKVLRAEMLSAEARQQMRTRLLREAQAMARLCHPEVITVYDVGSFGDQLFVAMEHLDAGTLRQWRAAKHRSVAQILAIYERAGSGLAAAHEAGLVHRDFKPDNVLVGTDGRVRVTDFGLARSLIASHVVGPASVPREGDPLDQRSTTTTLTRTGTLLGTPAYMAPEQLRGEVADARSDIFSFCVALYEALYGERPFDGSNVARLRAAIDRNTPRAAPMMTRVPRWVRTALLRGMRAAPEERFGSMRDLLEALRAGQARFRRRRLALAGIGAAMGILAAGGAYSRRTPSSARDKQALTTLTETAAPATPAAGPEETSAAVLPVEPTTAGTVTPAAPPDASVHAALTPSSFPTRELSARAGPPQAPPPKLGTNRAPILR
jgi:serine/threonine protein kinase